MQQFVATIALEFVSTDIEDQLAGTPDGQNHVVIITYGGSKITCEIITAKSTTAQMETVSLDHWVSSYDISTYVLSGNRL